MFESEARQLAERLRSVDSGFLTLAIAEFRTAFGIQRLTENQANAVVEALLEEQVYVVPHPFYVQSKKLRIYDMRLELGQIVRSMCEVETDDESALRHAAETFGRARAGRELRSEDVPWMDAFDVLLQLIAGREPEGWEELRDDRHPSMLIRELADAMGVTRTVVDEPWVISMATAVCSLRPTRRQYRAEDFAPDPMTAPAAGRLVDALESRAKRVREEYERVLLAAVAFGFGVDEPPDVRVELGLLGLRRKREDRTWDQ